MLCLECGKREAKYDGLCEECFLKKTRFTDLPRHIDMVMCPHCHAIKFGGHWESVSMEDAIFVLVDRNLKFLHEYDSYTLNVEHGAMEGEFAVLATIDIKYRGLTTQEIHEILFDVKYESCPRCNRYFGNYFEAILQLRGMRDYEVSELLNFVHSQVAHYAEKNLDLFITKEVEKKEGWDFYLSDKREARKIARDLARTYGAEIKKSPKIVGRKDGQDIYRVTYSVRLPPYRSGDIVVVDGAYYELESINGHFITAQDIVELRKKHIDTRRHDVVLVREKNEIEEMMVIYQDGDNVQLLSKDNRVVETRANRPLKSGANVRTVTIEDNIYILPA